MTKQNDDITVYILLYLHFLYQAGAFVHNDLQYSYWITSPVP